MKIDLNPKFDNPPSFLFSNQLTKCTYALLTGAQGVEPDVEE